MHPGQSPPGAFLFGKIIFEKIEYLPVAIEPPPVAIEYLKSVKRPKSGMQSHRLKTPFSEKKAQILQSLTQICRN